MFDNTIRETIKSQVADLASDTEFISGLLAQVSVAALNGISQVLKDEDLMKALKGLQQAGYAFEDKCAEGYRTSPPETFEEKLARVERESYESALIYAAEARGRAKAEQEIRAAAEAMVASCS